MAKKLRGCILAHTVY